MLPAVAVTMVMLVQFRVLRRLDELQRRIQLEALAFGYPVAIITVILVRFVQAEGFLGSGSLGDVWPLVVVPYFLGLALARWRYR